MNEISELDNVTRALRNLMAVINRDGGHRVGQFSSDIDTAKDCQATVAKMLGSMYKMRSALLALKSRVLLKSIGVTSEFSPSTAASIACICEEALDE